MPSPPCSLRMSPSASAATCESLTSLHGAERCRHARADGRARCVHAAGGRAAGLPAVQNAFAKLAIVLPRGGHAQARAAIRHQGGSVAAVGGWNGKLQVVGNGGFAGTISYPAMATALAAGYAAASTDTGHTGPSSNTFANEDVLIDFAHRAIHETTVAAKATVNGFYGNAPKFCVLQRLLDGWPSGADRGAAISRGLQRHRRRRAREPHLDAGLRADLVLSGAGRSGSALPREKLALCTTRC